MPEENVLIGQYFIKSNLSVCPSVPPEQVLSAHQTRWDRGAEDSRPAWGRMRGWCCSICWWTETPGGDTSPATLSSWRWTTWRNLNMIILEDKSKRNNCATIFTGCPKKTQSYNLSFKSLECLFKTPCTYLIHPVLWGWGSCSRCSPGACQSESLCSQSNKVFSDLASTTYSHCPVQQLSVN